jgi:chromosome segregation ATPase
MFNLLEDQFLDDAVFRAEQSRFSYTLQMEEFRSLNSNLQVYLNDIKSIDDENHQLQENIEQLRTNYVVTLESHLKRLPEDFRQESQTLTEAHLERYKSKSRAKRFSNEREELKKRIHFLVTNEKDQTKRLNHLQKQDRSVTNEFKSLNQQIQTLYHYVQTEKHNHQEAMNKVDHLQIQLEEICIERSKTEFEIQTLREEVKLMQTAKEFLDEEHQTIVSTRTEANEYLLSRLNDAISRIREDFNELNKNQIKQFENEYQQMMKILEETPPINELIQKDPISYETLQDDYQSITQELTTLNGHHQNLSERILNMEADFYSIRDARLRELISKDNELERTEMELQTLNEKLNHLAEYDRNLQFELTLYRGVLESEYRRKQLSQNQQPIRPTTLRTTINRSHKNSPVRITKREN